MNDDADLLRQYASDNAQDAFAELVRRHVDLVYSVALTKVGRDAHAAQDVAQAVFIALARQAGELSGRRTLVGWLYLTTHHQAAQLVRTERRRQSREIRAQTMNEILNTPEIDWTQFRPMLDETLQELGEAEREVILLRYFEGQPFADIGRLFQVSEDAARMRADRALEKLRTLLSRRGVSSSAAVLAGVLTRQVAAAPSELAGAISSSVAALPPVPPQFFMSTTQLLVSAGLAAALAAFILARPSDSQVTRRTVLPSPQSAPPALAATAPALGRPRLGDRQGTSVAPIQAAWPPLPGQEEREPRDTPEVQRAELARQLGNYQPLLDKLSLTAGQRSAFNRLVLESLQRQADIREVGRTGGTRPVDFDLEALRTEAEAELSARILAAFGAETQAAFNHYNETGPAREFVHHLTEALAATATPLTAAQAAQLIEIVAQRSRRVEGRTSSDPRSLDLEAAVTDAQTLLSPPQLAALRQAHGQLR